MLIHASTLINQTGGLYYFYDTVYKSPYSHPGGWCISETWNLQASPLNEYAPGLMRPFRCLFLVLVWWLLLWLRCHIECSTDWVRRWVERRRMWPSKLHCNNESIQSIVLFRLVKLSNGNRISFLYRYGVDISGGEAWEREVQKWIKNRDKGWLP